MTTLPRLYKSTKTGAVQICDISYEGDTYYVKFGQLDGKLQVNSTKCQGTNIGRSNERTPTQQAEFEALADHKKKIKSGYALTMETPSEVTLPAKVKVYQENLKNIKFPCFSTPKLNGVNGLYKREGQTITLYSRGGEIYPEIPHLTPLIHLAMDKLNCNELNGEIYIHRAHLQDIQSAVKKPNELSPKLTFAIFDIPDCKAVYKDRRDKLIAFDNELVSDSLYVLYGIECNSHDELESHYTEMMKHGYEGTVIYNHDHLYIYNQRSSNAFKYKKALDAEFLIVGYELDKNNLPVFILESAGGEFKAKPVGTKEYWSKQIPATYIGQYATVEYEVLSKSGIPLKGVFISTRECDNNGNPLV